MNNPETLVAIGETEAFANITIFEGAEYVMISSDLAPSDPFIDIAIKAAKDSEAARDKALEYANNALESEEKAGIKASEAKQWADNASLAQADAWKAADEAKASHEGSTDAKEAAEAAAEAAKESETLAGQSQEAAASSEEAAERSAEAAAASASDSDARAEDSANSAKESAQSAGEAATSAGDSDRSAKASASSAGESFQSAQDAQQSAESAASSERNADQSAIDANAAKNASEGARDLSNEYAEQSKGYRDESRGARDASARSAKESGESATASANSATDSLNHANDSDKSAGASAGSATASANSAADSADSAADAALSQTNASDSASAAATSEQNAAAYRDTAKDWATKRQGSTVDGKDYSAKHYALQAGSSAQGAASSEKAAEEAADRAAAEAGKITDPLVDQGNFDPRGGTYPSKPLVSSIWYCVGSNQINNVIWHEGDHLIYSHITDRFSQLTGDPVDAGKPQPFEVPDDLLMQPKKAIRFKGSQNDPDPMYAVGLHHGKAGEKRLIIGDKDAGQQSELALFCHDANSIYAVEAIDTNNDDKPIPNKTFPILSSKNGVTLSGTQTLTGTKQFNAQIKHENDFVVSPVTDRNWNIINKSALQLFKAVPTGTPRIELRKPRAMEAQENHNAALTRKDYVDEQNAKDAKLGSDNTFNGENKFNDTVTIANNVALQTIYKDANGANMWGDVFKATGNNGGNLEMGTSKANITFFGKSAINVSIGGKWGEIYTTLNKPKPGDLGAADASALNTHIANQNNPHNVTLAGLKGVPDTRTVNGKRLNTNITLGSGDVGAVPTGRKVNGKALTSDITLTADNVGAAKKNGDINQPFSTNKITFKAEASDAASIGTSISGTGTYFDFNLADDAAGNDRFRWRFKVSNDSDRNNMELYPSASGANKARLNLFGEMYAGNGSNRVYHQGWKPTAADVKALPISGGTMTGQLNASKKLTAAGGGTIGGTTVSNASLVVDGSMGIDGNEIYSNHDTILGTTANNILFKQKTNTISTFSMGGVNVSRYSSRGASGFNAGIYLSSPSHQGITGKKAGIGFHDTAPDTNGGLFFWNKASNGSGGSYCAILNHVRFDVMGSIKCNTEHQYNNAINFDNLNQTSFHNLYNNTGTGKPPITYGTLLTIGRGKASGSFATQIATDKTQGNTYIRSRNDGGFAWTGWKQLAFTDRSYTKSESDGRYTPKVLPDHTANATWYYPTWFNGSNTLFTSKSKLSFRPSDARFKTGTFEANNWFRSSGSTGWFNETHGGGIHMSDSTWIRTYGGKKFHVANTSTDAVYTTGGVRAGYNESFAYASQYGTKAPFWHEYTSGGSSEYHPCVKIKGTRSGGDSWVSSFGQLLSGTSIVQTNIHAIRSNGTAKIWNFDHAAGNFTSPGNVTAYSDRRVKEDIRTIDNALNKVEQINGITYVRTDDENRDRQVGVIAQEVEKVLPEAVSEQIHDELGTIKTVAYGNMVGLLVEAIKELKSEVDDLRSQLDER